MKDNTTVTGIYEMESSHPDVLASQLMAGWAREAKDPVGEIERLISRAFNVPVILVEIEQNHVVLKFSLDAVRFRHFDEIYCVIVGGTEVDIARLSMLKHRWISDARFLMVLAPDAFDLSAIFSARAGFLVVGTREWQEITRSADPVQAFRSLAVQRISRHRLNPFNTLIVPSKNMFLGREDGIELLLQSESTSWAIAGPGRIGKSSLLQHYILALREVDPERKQRVAHVDFYYEDATTEDAVSQRIARAVNDNSRAQEVTLSSLKRFILWEYNRRGRIELLFDEVDKVCRSAAFLKIAELAKEGVCRLVLCGKEALYESLHDSNHQLHGRLQHLRLAPLSREESSQLFTRPLCDLEFRVIDQEAIMTEVYRDTSGYPHLIQHLGASVVRLAVAEKRDIVDLAFLDKVRNNFEIAQFFVAPIQNLKDEQMELIALSILHEHSDKITESGIRQIVAREGLRLDAKRVSEIGRALYINNVLSWDGAAYQVATGGLRRYARKLGYFLPRLLELQKTIGRLAPKEAKGKVN